jgi:CRP-like cAMP-binding protein
MEGVIAVDTLAAAADATVVTIRLAGAGDYLNLQNLLGKGAIKCRYVCEKKAVVCLAKIDHIKRRIEETNPQEQLLIVKELAGAMQKQVNDLMDSATWLGSSPAEPRTEWALKRLYALTRCPDLPLTRSRTATHIGANIMTVTRALKALQDRGAVSQMGRNLIKLRGFL